ncbi:NUDIX hydrolase [Candidatus Woesearchaeota archaeon]|jgi:ADP-ribose pyrophosphatase YjhB (NUDIX family)|nr:NUDIX hydrolase [Candidatus Woesearchaeota archaeon]MBT6520007.1 NUDIX hydrolase [Candidatus Woesearchaeota archaeon]MBT7367746.1 NUDIX hydrolase [Candidatus Woesearchaeota archaeon]
MLTIDSAGGILIKEVDGVKNILLCKRASTEPRFPGCWGCPAGRRDNQEESFEEIAVREVNEETGLEFNIGSLFGIYGMQLDDRKVITHLFLGDFSGEICFDFDEVEDCKWLTYSEAKKLELSFFYDEVLDNLFFNKLL